MSSLSNVQSTFCTLTNAQYPFPHTEAAPPLKARHVIENFKSIQQLAQAVAAFYARFLQAEWHQAQYSEIEFSRCEALCPTEAEGAAFQKTLAAAIVRRFESRAREMNLWSINLSTQPEPRGLLLEACREIRSCGPAGLKALFPQSSNLTLHYNARKNEMVVSWTAHGKPEEPRHQAFAKSDLWHVG